MPRTCNVLGGAVLSLILAAAVCLAGPAAEAPADVTPAAGPAPEVLDARPGAATAIGLIDCVTAALAGNDDLRAERERRRELDGQMNQALSTGLPSLDAVGTWTRGRDPSFALDETFAGGGDGEIGTSPLDTLLAGFDFLPAPGEIPAQTYWRASLDLNWTINPSKILGAVGAAGLGIRRQDQAIVAKEHETVERAVIAYHGVILAAEKAAAAEASLANHAEFLDIVRLRYRLGLASDIDTLQAAVAVANLRPRVRQARRNLRTAGADLNAVMGRRPVEPISVVVEQAVETDPLDRDRALRMAAGRPDLMQMDLFADLLRQNRRAQKAEMRPYLSLNGSYGYVGREASDLNDEGHDYWSASVALNVPLFDGLLTRGLVQETEASIRRTEMERGGMLRRARVEVLDLLDNLEAARLNLAAAELNMTAADELLEISKLRLREGLADYLTVLESESGRADARSNLIQARYDVLTLTASLKRAVGISPLLPLSVLSAASPEVAR